MDDSEARVIVEQRMDDLESLLLNDGRLVSQTVAGTNAVFFGMDEYAVRYARLDKTSGRIVFRAFLHFDGQQDEQKPFLGDELDVELIGELKCYGAQWQLSYYNIESCKLNA
jgi:hypothetical protein